MGRRVVVVLQGSPPTPVSAVHFLDELTIHFLRGVPAQQQGLFGQIRLNSFLWARQEVLSLGMWGAVSVPTGSGSEGRLQSLLQNCL